MPLDNNADNPTFAVRAKLAENGAVPAAAAKLLGGKPADQKLLRLNDDPHRMGAVTRLIFAKLASATLSALTALK